MARVLKVAERAAAPSERIAEAPEIRRLKLTHFRSWPSLEIAFDGRPVVLAGPNGAGKTNLLEALSLFGPGRGLRGAPLEDLPARAGPGDWAVAAEIACAGTALSFGVGARVSAPNRRECRIDDRPAGPSAFADYVRFLWLTPAEDGLFREGAGERRRFLDRMANARDPAYARAAGDYDQAMRERQTLLDEGRRDDGWLLALEAEMARSGAALAASRRETVAALLAAGVEDGGVDPLPAADIALDGELEAALDRTPAADVEDDFAARLRSNREADRQAGRALIGPHRTDLVVRRRQGRLPARLCSTGEQKALLVWLFLAHARALALEARFRVRPAPLVLLFDEIAAHFDAARRRKLCDALAALGFQTFMTGTDLSLFSGWGRRAQAFAVGGGAVKETTVT